MPGKFDYVAMGTRVRECRRALGVTQEELAEMASVSASFIGHIERGEKQPSLETVVNLCKCLGVSTDYLVLGRKRQCEPVNCSLREDLQKLVNTYPIDMRNT